MSKEEGLGSRLKSLFTRPKRQSQAALNTAEDRKPYAVSAEHLQVRFRTGQPKMGQCSGTSEWDSHRFNIIVIKSMGMIEKFCSRSPPGYPINWFGQSIYTVGKPLTHIAKFKKCDVMSCNVNVGLCNVNFYRIRYFNIRAISHKKTNLAQNIF